MSFILRTLLRRINDDDDDDGFSRQSVWNRQRRLLALVSAGARTQQVVLRVSGFLLLGGGRPHVRRKLFVDVAVPLRTDRRPLHSRRVDVRRRGRLPRRLR